MSNQINILVTGGAGFIGSHTCKELAKNNYLPITIDNLSTGRKDSVRWGPFYEGDVADTAFMKSVIQFTKPELVIHFAASAYVGESVQNPAKYYKNNLNGILGMLDACLEEKLLNIIFSSSCATYGIPQTLPITEVEVQRPINPYGFTKLACEQILKDYSAAYGLHSGILRYFNASGADPDGELGEFHDPETHLIPIALQTAYKKRKDMQVFGSNYDTKDGTCIRDFIHVSDLARAHVLATKTLLQNQENFEVNLGTGNPFSVKQVIQSVSKVTGKPVPYELKHARKGDPATLYADTRKAKDILGFEAEIISLEEIIRTAAPWFEAEAAQ